MAKTNYNKISKKSEITTKDAVETNESIIEETETLEDVKEEIVKSKVVTGIVSDCSKLNIRNDSSLDADVIGTLDKGTTVVIHGEVGDFYKIGNPNANEFCMKKFISINK